ncbi:quinone oxidoreductase [[Actinomadura] parvosata subsp. kistnae]|uniref:Oxidoreductase n=1 Tax=[Actinomadura] parvosata subsp. kistnae TaxID=1909395 RepID=A0A1U9ZZG0_9ACTN|nr:zinc-binding dehydrogenase [Nonomuraea sp. ATCC 55076]AQZ63346.1 oxidoreductase [Nonomuraea sp. ATCC 55076]SPL99053.1 quinone oxidoreductase [Actinomadura parvosata subsp. kistnae]
MKAVVLGADDAFQLSEVPDPVAGPGEVAIRAAYAGVQYGDVLVRQGHFPIPRPFVPGFEVAGEIVAVGDGVDSARIGEQVVALIGGGGYAEVVTAPAMLAINAAKVDARTAAGFGWVTPTAYDLINTVARVRPGDSVLIHAAAGGVGTLAGQFAAAAGAQRIVGVVGNAGQIGHARRSGYHEVLVREQFPAALDERTFDVILDPIGGPARVASLERLAPHGRIVVYGNIATFEPVTVSVNDLLTQGQSLLTYNSNLAARTHPSRLAGSATRAMALVADGTVRIDVTAEYALADVETAIAHLADGTTHGKSVVRVS